MTTLLFPFKGSRTYVHGTDMFNKVCKELTTLHKDAPPRSLKFIIHRMTSYNLDLTIEENAENTQAGPSVVTLSYEAEGTKYLVRLNENQNSSPTQRIPYDESRVISLCHLNKNEKKISLPGQSPFTFIETIVAMNKALVTAVLPEAPGSWVFCRLESDAAIADEVSEGIEIIFKHNLGTRLTCSEVMHNGSPIAKIYFSAKVR